MIYLYKEEKESSEQHVFVGDTGKYRSTEMMSKKLERLYLRRKLDKAEEILLWIL